MMPHEDPTWPDHRAISPDIDCKRLNEEEISFCNHYRKFFADGMDADSIVTGVDFCVPIAPQLNVYATVLIDENPIATGIHEILVIEEDTFLDERVPKSIGMWTRGEGRLSIASTAIDYARASLDGVDPKCKNKSHSFDSEMKLQKAHRAASEAYSNGEHNSPALAFTSANIWCHAVFGMCYFCHASLMKNMKSFGQVRDSIQSAVTSQSITFGNTLQTLAAGFTSKNQSSTHTTLAGQQYSITRNNPIQRSVSKGK